MPDWLRVDGIGHTTAQAATCDGSRSIGHAGATLLTSAFAAERPATGAADARSQQTGAAGLLKIQKPPNLARMSDYRVLRIDEIPAVVFGSFKRARAALGVESFGMQVIDLPPNSEHHPRHDHHLDGQEEVYVVLRGGGQIEIDGTRHVIDPETLVRVGPKLSRKLWPGQHGMRVLVLGGVPGRAYSAPEVTRLEAPDPGMNISAEMTDRDQAPSDAN